MPLHQSHALPPLVLPGTSRTTNKHAPAQSSHLILAPSPTSFRAIPRTPLIAPPRLRLRSILPSPPISPQYLKSAPEYPHPWIWRCHLCKSTYRLGVTRRCLNDGHFFCSVPSRPPTSEDEGHVREQEGVEGASAAEVLLEKERQNRDKDRRRQQTRRQRKALMGCSSEFDYIKWAQYNSWRRCIRVYKFEEAAHLRRQMRSWNFAKHGYTSTDEDWDSEDENMVEYQEKKNCWVDCEYPSECQNIAQQEENERRQVWESLVEELPSDGEESWKYEGKVMDIAEWEAELQKQNLSTFESQGPESLTPSSTPSSNSSSTTTATTSPASSTSESALEPEEIDIVDIERLGIVGEAQMILSPPPCELPSFGIGESEEDMYSTEFATKKRKKSVQKIAQLTGLMLGVEPVQRRNDNEGPKSPLKDGFTWGEVWDNFHMGGDEDADQEGFEGERVDVTREVEHEERRRNLSRTKVGRGGVGEFGDEDEDHGIM